MAKSESLVAERPTSAKRKSSSKNTPITNFEGYFVVETEEEFDLENDFRQITWEEAEQARLASIKPKKAKDKKAKA